MDDNVTAINLRRLLEDFDEAWASEIYINEMADAVYETLAIAIPYVCVRENVLDDDQHEFLGFAQVGVELVHEDVWRREEQSLSSRDLARSFVRPLMLFLGLFAELIGDKRLNEHLPAMRTVLVVQTMHSLAADWDLCPELLLPLADDLSDAIESYDLGAIARAVLDFRDGVVLPHHFTGFDLSIIEADPLRRFTEAEIAEFRASMTTGYGWPSVPRFADGPRLERLRERINAIGAGTSSEEYNLEELQRAVIDIEQHREHLIRLNEDARRGLVGFTPTYDA